MNVVVAALAFSVPPLKLKIPVVALFWTIGVRIVPPIRLTMPVPAPLPPNSNPTPLPVVRLADPDTFSTPTVEASGAFPPT